jgi:FAD synthetase
VNNDLKTVMAQGTFDLIHPGHIHYLEKSAELGEKLVVVIARDSRVEDRKDLFFSEDERKEMIGSFEMVDQAALGSEGDIYSTVESFNPDVITLGGDQGHSESEVKEMAEKATGHKVEVVRLSEFGDYSSSKIRESL